MTVTRKHEEPRVVPIPKQENHRTDSSAVVNRRYRKRICGE